MPRSRRPGMGVQDLAVTIRAPVQAINAELRARRDFVEIVTLMRGNFCSPLVFCRLHVVRFGGDEDIVPRAAQARVAKGNSFSRDPFCQAQRLPNWNFLIRVKIPLPLDPQATPIQMPLMLAEPRGAPGTSCASNQTRRRTSGLKSERM